MCIRRWAGPLIEGQPTRSLCAQVDDDILDLRKEIDPVPPQLAPEAALLVATERGVDVIDGRVVDRDVARLQPPRNSVGDRDVACPDRRAEAVGDVVGL